MADGTVHIQRSSNPNSDCCFRPSGYVTGPGTREDGSSVQTGFEKGKKTKHQSLTKNVPGVYTHAGRERSLSLSLRSFQMVRDGRFHSGPHKRLDRDESNFVTGGKKLLHSDPPVSDADLIFVPFTRPVHSEEEKFSVRGGGVGGNRSCRRRTLKSVTSRNC